MRMDDYRKGTPQQQKRDSLGIFLKLLSIILLLIALAPSLPFEFYTVLRWFVCVTAIFTAIFSYSNKRPGWIFPFFGIAILFNPIRPFHLEKEIWYLIDIIVATFFVISILSLRGSDVKNKSSDQSIKNPSTTITKEAKPDIHELHKEQIIDEERMEEVKWKEGWDLERIKKFLGKNKINTLYHFTDKSNLSSIKEHGGLYSWAYLEKNNIDIRCPGGNQSSRDLDLKKGLHDYVHLTFVKKPPMLHKVMKDGRIREPVILGINPIVMFFRKSLYSNRNAAAKNANIGSGIATLEKIRFDIINKDRWNGEVEKGYYQAEVLVQRQIPLKYIIDEYKIRI